MGDEDTIPQQTGDNGENTPIADLLAGFFGTPPATPATASQSHTTPGNSESTKKTPSTPHETAVPLKDEQDVKLVPQSPLPNQMTARQRAQLKQRAMNIRTLEEIHQKLRQAASNLETLTLEKLEGFETLINSNWAELLSLQDALIDFIPEDLEDLMSSGLQQASATKTEGIQLLYEIKGELRKKHQQAVDPTATQLSRLNPPTFSGKYPEWKQFSDGFLSLVGRTSMPAVQKLIRLRESLKGPAAELIASFHLTEDNYERAWAKLENKYNNPRVIAASLFNKLLSMPTVTNPTPENINANGTKAVEVLDQLLSMTELPKEELIEQFIAHLVTKTMDPDTRNTWEVTMGQTKQFPKLKELVDFLDACARGRHHGTSVNSAKQNRQNRGAVHLTSNQQPPGQGGSKNPNSLQYCCKYCKEKHYIGQCQKFRALPPIKRYEVVIRERCCFNCLGSHRINMCSQLDKKCLKCNENHHTLLHGVTLTKTGPPRDPWAADGRPPTGDQNQANNENSQRDHQATSENRAITNQADTTRENNQKQTTSNITEVITQDLMKSNDKLLPNINEPHQITNSTELITNDNQVINESQNILPTNNVNQSSINNIADKQQRVLLATAQALAHSPKGFVIQTRLLIDQGSELSFITENLVHQLRLQRRATTIELVGIGGTNSGSTRGVVTLTLQSTTSTKQHHLSAHILRKLTTILPTFSCQSASIGSLEGLQLADKDYLQPGSVDIIIGADNYGRIIEDEVVRSDSTQLVGQRTIFGWIISGPICCNDCSKTTSLTAVKKTYNEQLLELLQRFWNQEEIPSKSTKYELAPEDHQCEEHFKETHQRDDTGRYIVRLPFRTSTNALGDSKQRAQRQLEGVLRRLRKDETYAKLYNEFLNEYESLGHMQRVPPESPEPSTVYYLPHHGVLREDAITTKLRVVFNGSSPSSTKISLNDILHSGEKLQVDAMDVLTWFRKHRYVVGTDIEKMFRQIKVHPDDWDLQRILWYNEEEQQYITYQLTTVTYGLNCSPWHSLRCLQQLIIDEGHRYPKAVETLTKGRYVDDIYGGANTENDLKITIKQLIGLCQAGGFPLQKWSTNEPRLLQQLGLATEESTIDFEEKLIKVLGLCWKPAADTFQYRSKIFNSTKFTKRELLSEIAQIFDPLGFIAPVVIKGKLIIQELWKMKLNWDDPLPLEYVRQWRSFREEFTKIDQISLPRWLRLSSSTTNVQIHGFADASTAAMAAVVYLRTQDIEQPTTIRMVCAKTRVAPIKRTTIPRLELNAATMLSQLVLWVVNTLEIREPEIHLWSDSTIALTWINSHPSRWKDYVHNRVVKIQEALPTAHWRHISGVENPADCASRGLTAQQLVDQNLWWDGPTWLRVDEDHWPSTTPESSPEASTEEKPVPAHPAVRIRVHALAEVLERYSTLERALQVTATLNRAIDRFRRLPAPQQRALTTEELNDARLFWVKITQSQHFAPVLQILTNGNQLPTHHPLAKLTPILDDNNIIRLGGRLKNALLDQQEIHPIILPRSSKLTTLVIEQAHRRTLHGGTQQTLADTRQKYWIIGGRTTVRHFIHQCVICTRHRARTAQQLMGQLPSQRVSPARAFLHTGVDYAGPLPILKWRPTNAQPTTVHIVVFVCFTTSAVHLELVTRQTTDAFIGAYKRFTGRRGIPEKIYSDNASTLVGASTVLDRLYRQGTDENQRVQAALSTHGTQWSFIPPRAPHFGGKWEAAVKSVKTHLRKIMGNQTLTYEELNSILIQIEACLNSRPIAPLTDDPNDLQALTPGHFLIGEPLQLLPEPSVLNENPTKLQRWNLITQKVQQFWKRWSRECLQRYQAIYNWNRREPNIKVGDMVLMVAEDYPPTKWPLARVIRVSPGQDGLTRVATIKTAHAEVPTAQDGTPQADRVRVTVNTFNRPITKLCLLPVNYTEPEHSEEEEEDQPVEDNPTSDEEERQPSKRARLNE